MLTSCQPTYTRDTLLSSVAALCQKEYGLEVQAELVGKTLYLITLSEEIIGLDLELAPKSFKPLEDMMLSATRAALSSEAEIDFIVVEAEDLRLGMVIRLVRYIPDVKRFLYLGISRTDFAKRLVLKTILEQEEGPRTDIKLSEFLADQMAFRLKQQVTVNFITNDLLRITKVDGSYPQEGTIQLMVSVPQEGKTWGKLETEILTRSISEIAQHTVKVYEFHELQNVQIVNTLGEMLLTIPVKPKDKEQSLWDVFRPGRKRALDSEKGLAQTLSQYLKKLGMSESSDQSENALWEKAIGEPGHE